jgi:hypothetical protein
MSFKLCGTDWLDNVIELNGQRLDYVQNIHIDVPVDDFSKVTFTFVPERVEIVQDVDRVFFKVGNRTFEVVEREV